MIVSGFTFIKNAIRFDFPILEAIASILPLCDEVVVAVGNSDDGTLELIQKIDSKKIKIVQTVWDETLRQGGRVLAEETNKALDATRPDADWCLYIQGDEVLHEDGLEALRSAMLQWRTDPKVEGLLLNYRHFWGSYHYLADSRKWYRREVRVVRRNPAIRSWKDAQGFRLEGRKLKVKPTEAWIHHYGWVKHPQQQMEKRRFSVSLYHNDAGVAKRLPASDSYDYGGLSALSAFRGKHPAVMQRRVDNMSWSFAPSPLKLPLKERASRLFEKLTGWRIGEYKNYKVV